MLRSKPKVFGRLVFEVWERHRYVALFFERAVVLVTCDHLWLNQVDFIIVMRLQIARFKFGSSQLLVRSHVRGS